MTISTLVDTNVLIDLLRPEDDPARPWSVAALRDACGQGTVVFSAVIWAELCCSQLPEERLVSLFSYLNPRREAFPFAAAYAAGRAQRLYRERGGRRERTLPDFLIGAHALVGGHRLLTRDGVRYRGYFPDLSIIEPDSHP